AYDGTGRSALYRPRSRWGSRLLARDRAQPGPDAAVTGFPLKGARAATVESVRSDRSDVVTAPAGWKPNAPETLAAENVLYPELAAHGQLARAIQAAAAELAVDLGAVVPVESHARRSARVGSTVPERKPLKIGIGAVERWFLVSGWSRGVQLVSGAT